MPSGTVALDPLVAERLGLSPGDEVRVGEARLRVAGTVRAEPDKIATPAIFGPRALVTLDTLAETQLLQPGSLVQHDYRVRLPPGASPKRLAADLQAAFAAEGWRVRVAVRRPDEVFVSYARLARVVRVFGPLVLYVAAIGFVGLYVASALFVVWFMLTLGSFRWWSVALAGVLVPLVVFWTFEVQFRVPLPKGPLEAWLGY